MTTTNQAKTITAEALDQSLVAGIVNLIDVREMGEYRSEKIPGSEVMPLSKFQVTDLPRDPEKTIVLCCQSGRRSQQALNQCVAAGLENVVSLEGGLNAWKTAGYQTQKDKNAPISIFRQVQIVAGSLVFIGTILGAFVSPKFLILSGFVGAGLVFAGVTNTCAMGMLLAKLPYNQK